MISSLISRSTVLAAPPPPDVLLEEAPCPLGCAPSDVPVIVGRDRISNVPGEFQVVRCAQCGLMRTSPRPTAATIGAYYPPSYGPFEYTRANAGPARPAPRQSPLRAVGARVIRSDSFALPPLSPSHALELGCASGSFLAHLQSSGWSVEGVEPSPGAAEFARSRGFRVQSCAVEDMEPPERAPGLVIGWMVVEHMHDPLKALSRIADWSAPDARLVVSVPNAQSLVAKIFRDQWYALQVPCHLWHFTPKSLTKLLDRAGWTVERILHQRVLTDYLSSSGNVLESLGAGHAGDWLRRLSRKRSTFITGYPLATLLSYAGQTGRMTVWAKKTSSSPR